MARNAIGVDVGSRTAVALKGIWKGGTFHLSGASVASTAGARDVEARWAALRPDFKLAGARVGIGGREVNVRYSRVPEVPDWQLRNLMRFEVQEIGDQSGSEVASDFNLLPRPPEIAGEDVVLLAMSRESLLEQHEAGLDDAGGTLDAFTPSSVALYTAFARYGVVDDDTVLVADIGHDTTDVAIVRGADLLFARNLSGGAGLFDEALVQRLGLSAGRAEEAKIDAVDLTPGARPRSSEGEKATRAVMGAAGQLMSLLQSAVMFCKSQVKLSGLKLDRVLVCGGGAAIQGLPEYLSAGMGVPVERFDAFHVVDTSGLSPEEADVLAEHELESVVALGLATMASDPEAYSLELLPGPTAKKREFLGATIWMIAAAVLLVGLLGVKAYATKTEMAELETRRASYKRQEKRVKDLDRATESLLAQADELGRRARELQAVAGTGEQLARTLQSLDQRLPAEFWVEKVESHVGSDAELGVDSDSERPLLRIEGRARDSAASPTALFQRMLVGLEEDLGDTLVMKPTFDGKRFTIDLTLYSPLREGALEGDADDADAEDSAGA
ncbi:MAG: pilus assembly protein PilM [Planctomycetota bacterium]